MERDRDELQKKLEIANKELAGRNNKGVASRVLDMENEMAGLRARLEVFEARAVPYTAEELALFKRPEINLAGQDANAGKKSVKALPGGCGRPGSRRPTLFFRKAVRQSGGKISASASAGRQKRRPALANLATIQIERNHLDDAEKHIKQAVAIAPEDAYSCSMLGQSEIPPGEI